MIKLFLIHDDDALHENVHDGVHNHDDMYDEYP